MFIVAPLGIDRLEVAAEQKRGGYPVCKASDAAPMLVMSGDIVADQIR